MEFSTSSITDILTLRYDPSLTPNLPKKSWNDFVTNNDIPNLDTIENLICLLYTSDAADE